MKKINLLGYLSMALIFIFISCNSEEGILEINKKSSNQETICGDEKVVDLIAGQHINVGTVTVSNDETNLYVTYQTTGDWYLTETHLYVGAESDIPYTNKGNPKIGHFTYSDSHGNTQSYTYTIDLSTLDDNFAVITHAVVNSEASDSETAFGCGDKEFPGKRWGCYFDYTKQECEDENCMDAFAKKLDDEVVECVNLPINGTNLNAWSTYVLHNWLLGVTQNNSAFELPIYIKEVDDCNTPQTTHLGHVEYSLADNLQDIKIKYVLRDEFKDEYYIEKVNLYVGSEVNPYNADGTYKTGVTSANFYSGDFVEDNDIIMPWTSNDPYAQVNIIPHAKICKVQ